MVELTLLTGEELFVGQLTFNGHPDFELAGGLNLGRESSHIRFAARGCFTDEEAIARPGFDLTVLVQDELDVGAAVLLDLSDDLLGRPVDVESRFLGGNVDGLGVVGQIRGSLPLEVIVHFNLYLHRKVLTVLTPKLVSEIETLGNLHHTPSGTSL